MFSYEELTSLDSYKNATPDVQKLYDNEYAKKYWGELSTSPDFAKASDDERKQVQDIFDSRFNGGKDIREYVDAETADKQKGNESFGSSFIRGAVDVARQVPELGYGAMAGAAALGETAAVSSEKSSHDAHDDLTESISSGAKGILGDVKKYAVDKYNDWQKSAGATGRLDDSWTYSLDKAKNEGDYTSLAKWTTHQLGYTIAQGAEMFTAAGVGKKIAEGAIKAGISATIKTMVEKRAAEIAEESIIKAGLEVTPEVLSAAASDSAIIRKATSETAETLGEHIGSLGMAGGMEFGEIGGTVADKSVKDGRPLTPDEAKTALKGTFFATALEYADNILGLKAMKGKIPTLNTIEEMPGIKGRIARGVSAAAETSPLEYWQEYWQSHAEQYGEGKDPYSLESIKDKEDSGAAGAVSGILGLGGGILSRPKIKTHPTEILKSPTIDDAIKTFNDSVDSSFSNIDRELSNVDSFINKQQAADGSSTGERTITSRVDDGLDGNSYSNNDISPSPGWMQTAIPEQDQELNDYARQRLASQEYNQKRNERPVVDLNQPGIDALNNERNRSQSWINTEKPEDVSGISEEEKKNRMAAETAINDLPVGSGISIPAQRTAVESQNEFYDHRTAQDKFRENSTQSLNPEWARSGLDEYNNFLGLTKDSPDRVVLPSNDEMRNIVAKKSSGKELTARQQGIYDFLVHSGKKHPDFVAGEEADKLHKQGFEFHDETEVPAGSLGIGDEVVSLKKGVPDKLVVSGYDTDGRVIVKDGVTEHLSPEETIPIIARKEKNDPRKKEALDAFRQAEQLQDAPSDIAAYVGATAKKNYSPDIAPIVEGAAQRRIDALGRGEWSGRSNPAPVEISNGNNGTVKASGNKEQIRNIAVSSGIKPIMWAKDGWIFRAKDVERVRDVFGPSNQDSPVNTSGKTTEQGLNVQQENNSSNKGGESNGSNKTKEEGQGRGRLLGSTQSAISTENTGAETASTAPVVERNQEGKVPVVSTEPVAQKEPWEMTKGEWERAREDNRPNIVQSDYTKSSGSNAVGQIKRLEHLLYNVGAEDRRLASEIQNGSKTITEDERIALLDRLESRITHKRVIEKAIEEGKPVPAGVLAEYPDLSPHIANRQDTLSDNSSVAAQNGSNIEKNQQDTLSDNGEMKSLNSAPVDESMSNNSAKQSSKDDDNSGNLDGHGDSIPPEQSANKTTANQDNKAKDEKFKYNFTEDQLNTEVEIDVEGKDAKQIVNAKMLIDSYNDEISILDKILGCVGG